MQYMAEPTLFYFSDVNECSAGPCHNGGTCTNTFGSYKCTCVKGYQGSDCSKGNCFKYFIERQNSEGFN